MTIDSIMKRLDSISLMTMEGVKITSASVNSARTILKDAVCLGLPIPSIFPTWEGGVVAEWTQRGWWFEATFLPEGNVYVEAEPFYPTLITETNSLAVEISTGDQLYDFYNQYKEKYE